MFFKIGVLKDIANFTDKHLCWSLFLIKLMLTGDSNTDEISVKFAKFGNDCASLPWERLCQSHLETIVPAYLGAIVSVSLGNICASLTWSNRASYAWEQFYQYHMGTIVWMSLGNNRASLTWRQFCQPHLKQLCQCHLETTLPVSIGNNHISLTWEQTCQCHLLVKNNNGWKTVTLSFFL